jgi:hypothetical protein
LPGKWYANWDSTFDLSGGGTELSFRKGEIDTLLVETQAVRTIQSLAAHVNSPGLSSRYYLVGDRGSGKSTLLNYLAYSLYKDLAQKKALPVYTSMSGDVKDEEGLELAFYRSLLTSLFDIPIDTQRLRVDTRPYESVNRLVQAEIDFKNALIQFGHISLEFVSTAFENQLRHISSDFGSVVFLIDGLDKYDPAVVTKFLRKSQERLNSLIDKYSCMLVHAADPSWIQTLDGHEFTGVKGNRVVLRGWTTDEVMQLISRRLETLGIFVSPLKKEAVELLVAEFNGNPRKILQYSTILLNYAAMQQHEEIGPGLTRKVVWSDTQKKVLNDKVVADADFNYAYEKMKTVIPIPGVLSILVAIYGRGSLRKKSGYNERASLGITLTDAEFAGNLQALIDRGCLKFGATPDFVVLDDDVKVFFNEVKRLDASFEGLPVVFDEFESSLAAAAKLPREDIILRTEVIKVFESHPRDWLNSDAVCELLLENPRRARAIAERFGNLTDQRLTQLVPLIMGKLRDESRLATDTKTKTLRWRGQMLKEDFVDVVDCKEEIELAEDAHLMIDENKPYAVPSLCKKAVDSALDRLLSPLGVNPSKISLERKMKMLERLGIDTHDPIALETYLAQMLDVHDPTLDSSRILLNVCELYLKRVNEKLEEISKGDINVYVGKIQDPPYYSHLKELEQDMRNCVTDELSRVEADWWTKRIPEQVRTNCEVRKQSRETPYPWSEPTEYPPIYYADFTDYLRIVSQKENFQDCFGPIFGEISTLSMKLRELEPIRKDIAHSRNLTESQVEVLRVYSSQIRTAIESAKASRMAKLQQEQAQSGPPASPA